MIIANVIEGNLLWQSLELALEKESSTPPFGSMYSSVWNIILYFYIGVKVLTVKPIKISQYFFMC